MISLLLNNEMKEDDEIELKFLTTDNTGFITNPIDGYWRWIGIERTCEIL